MDNSDARPDSTDARIERAKDAALGSHSSEPSHIDEAGEAAGGIGGLFAGAAMGLAAGPIGVLIGGIAGAMGGWWSGRAVMEAITMLSQNEDAYYRAHYESLPNRLADRTYHDVRPAYLLGHVAAHNPEYRAKNWADVSNELQRAWTPEYTRRYGDWATMSRYAGEGFTHGSAQRQNSAPYRDQGPYDGPERRGAR
ncbi:MAG: hypothetical protein JWM95_5013 [Gemmatimonadetes bacterium]|nr:hypothetical protein [Gemmatimonadota bacterium]